MAAHAQDTSFASPKFQEMKTRDVVFFLIKQTQKKIFLLRQLLFSLLAQFARRSADDPKPTNSDVIGSSRNNTQPTVSFFLFSSPPHLQTTMDLTLRGTCAVIRNGN
jgi:hypothetical protein